MSSIIELLDIGGEGRYLDAWNLNHNRMKTLGPEKRSPIPRRIACGHSSFACELYVLDSVLVKAFVEVRCEHHTVVAGNTKEREKADPNGDTQVDRFDLKQFAHVGTKQTEVQKPVGAVQP